MEFKINIKKQHLVLLITAILVGSVGLVIAYEQNLGWHLASQIDGLDAAVDSRISSGSATIPASRVSGLPTYSIETVRVSLYPAQFGAGYSGLNGNEACNKYQTGSTSGPWRCFDMFVERWCVAGWCNDECTQAVDHAYNQGYTGGGHSTQLHCMRVISS